MRGLRKAEDVKPGDFARARRLGAPLLWVEKIGPRTRRGTRIATCWYYVDGFFRTVRIPVTLLQKVVTDA